MNYQVKNMIVNALIKIVDDAPKPVVQHTSYSQSSVVCKELFDIWMNYIFSVMQIISSYVDVNVCLSNINSVVFQPKSDNDYSLQVNAICKIIINFAQTILNS